MKVFVSWSGDPSKRVAELFRDWLPNVLQEIEVWVSSRDIGAGERSIGSISQNLEAHDFGILVITRGNIRSPWVMFEAGALSKMPNSTLIPVLCGVDRLDLAGLPIEQFQNVFPQKSDIQKVVREMNFKLVRPLPEQRLYEVFEKWWSEFESRFSSIGMVFEPEPVEAPPEPDRLGRIENVLESVLASIDALRKNERAPHAHNINGTEMQVYFDFIKGGPALEITIKNIYDIINPLYEIKSIRPRSNMEQEKFINVTFTRPLRGPETKEIKNRLSAIDVVIDDIKNWAM